MANANKPSGLTPVKYIGGANWDGKVNIYYIDSTDTAAYAVGDPVKLSGSGDTTRGIPGVTLGTAGATMLGVLVAAGVNPDGGPYIDPTNLATVKIPATKTQNYYVAVVDDPNVLFEAQEGGAGSNLAATNIGENIDFVTATPATGVNVSATYINNNAHDTTSTRNLKLYGLVRRSDNAIGAYAKWLVKMNNHHWSVGVTGV